MGKQYLLALVIPGVLGLGAYAAIVLTDDTEDLSAIRLTVAVVAMAVIWIGGSYLFGRRAYSRDIARIESGDLSSASGKGPDCERCGEPTRKPFLYNMPHTHWRCEPCEQLVTDIILGAAQNGTLTEEMLRYTRPYRVDAAVQSVNEALSDLFLRLGPPTPANLRAHADKLDELQHPDAAAGMRALADDLDTTTEK